VDGALEDWVAFEVVIVEKYATPRGRLRLRRVILRVRGVLGRRRGIIGV